MWTVYFALLGIGVVSAVVYLVFLSSALPEVVEDRLGVWEAPPQPLDEWCIDTDSPAAEQATAAGWRCEQRIIAAPRRWWRPGQHWLRQVRYKDASGMIVRVDPDAFVRRRRRRGA